MVFTLIENFVFFGAILALLAYIAAFFVRFGVQKNYWRITPFRLTRIYAGLILMPPVFSLWLVLAALLPETWLGSEVFRSIHFSPAHELHLLSELTQQFEPFLAYATVLFLSIISFFVIWKSVRSYLRIGGIIRFLQSGATTPEPKKIDLVQRIAEHYGLRVGVILSEQPLTFVFGIRRSKIIISSGLINKLDFAELAGVIEHEAAHHIRRDNLVKLLLSIAGNLSLVFPLTDQIRRWQAEQTELVCDEIAAVNTQKPLEIASALVKVRRMFPSLHINPELSSGFMTAEVPSIEFRVKRLLELADALPKIGNKSKLTNKPLFEIIFIIVSFVSSLAIASFLAPLTVHQMTETLISLIK
jgi:Zn-dependent protease with chaperone function